MKPIKHLALAVLTICVISSTQAQTIDCNTDFWTITADGDIQQWSLSNGAISGGDIILSGGGISLSYCGNSNAPTFFTDNWNQGEIGINYYDPDSGWINIPTANRVQDNGGHLMDQYYTVVGGVIQYVNYWDGTNLRVIDSLPGEFFAGIFDIGVDTSGHAWIFTASSPGTDIDSLKVYDQDGRINSYSFQYNIQGYGSFFLNGTLYLGTLQDSIFPVIIDGSTAQLGIGIPFPSNNFTDMASCQATESTTPVSEYSSTLIKTFPNPTDGNFSIDFGEHHEIVKVTVTDLGGKSILSGIYKNCQLLNLNLEEPAGIYLLIIESGNKRVVTRLVKE